MPVVQIELKTLGINPRRAIEQIVDYKNDPGNGYTRALLCFLQLFVVNVLKKSIICLAAKIAALKFSRDVVLG